jgi:hypothetical protein
MASTPISVPENSEVFNQIHIDIARNATDDFNLFHDSHRWSSIFQNPFHGPIVLGFQLESLIENKLFQHRQKNNENTIITKNNLNFSNYQFSFANAIRPEQNVVIEIKKTQFAIDKENPYVSNRVCVKADNKLALIGFKKETQQPLYLSEPDLSEIDKPLEAYADRSFIGSKDNSFFLKRKFMSVSNAKNFLCGSLVEQRLFFDELEDKYNFPEIFPCAFISCALLEKFLQKKLDFENEPMVYSSHEISVDRSLASQLKSNDILHVLIRLQKETNETQVQIYECYGLIKSNPNDTENVILFRAIVKLIPLAAILSKGK